MRRPNKMGCWGRWTTTGSTGSVTTPSGSRRRSRRGNAQVAGESREYNVLGQLTRIVAGSYDNRYVFSTTANDGRVTGQSTYNGGVLQETLGYGYDALNRLASAGTTAGSTSWSATYTYDRYTNLTGVTATGAGPAPMNIAVDAATNRVQGGGGFTT